MSALVDFVLHVDRHLLAFVQTYGAWVYGLLAAIIFAETGLVVTPFLPGDSLIFAAGAMAATGALNPAGLFVLLAAAAFAGNVANYAAGRTIGPRLFQATDRTSLMHRVLNHHHLARGHEFFERYGGKAVVLARFAPIIRTVVPFVAGMTVMTVTSFVLYSAIGASAWVALCVGAGYLFGNIPVVRNNFSLVTIGIVIVSLVPMGIEIVRQRTAPRRRPAGDTTTDA